MNSELPIVVIGGGWAGIAAAMELARSNKVILVEERPYLGGRARSFTDKTTLDEIDNGQHVLMGCYHATLSMLRTLGTVDSLQRQQALRVCFVGPTDNPDVLYAGRAPGSLGLLLGILALKRISWKAKLNTLILATAIRFGRVRATGLTCAQLFHRYGVPSDVITRFWEPVVLATLNASITHAPAELLLAVMTRAFLGSREDAQILVPTTGLSALIAPFPNWLENHGGTVLTSTSVDRVHAISQGQVRVELSNGSSVLAKSVVSCIPQRALSRLLRLSTIDDTLPEPVDMSPIVSMYLWYNTSWMTEDFVACIGTTTQWVFNKRQVHPGLVAITVSAGSAIVGSGGDELIAHCDGELRALFPKQLQGVQLLHAQVIKEKQATPLFGPASLMHRPDATALCSDLPWLTIGGDWTQTGLPATIEGAVQSGIAAANAAIRL